MPIDSGRAARRVRAISDAASALVRAGYFASLSRDTIAASIIVATAAAARGMPPITPRATARRFRFSTQDRR